MVSIFNWWHLVLSLIHYARYSLDGWGEPVLLLLSKICFMMSDLLMVMLLICLAKGWTIVRSKISPLGRMKMAVFFSTYLCAALASLIFFHTELDDEDINGFYYTAPGLALVILRCVAVVWFLYALHTTRRQFNFKLIFFSNFKPIGVVWLAYLPILVVIGLIVDDRVRNTMTSLELICYTIGQVGIRASTTRRTRVPFHQQTSSQLGIAGAGGWRRACGAATARAPPPPSCRSRAPATAQPRGLAFHLCGSCASARLG